MSELDKPIHVGVLSMRWIHMFLDRLLNVKWSHYFSPKLNIFLRKYTASYIR